MKQLNLRASLSRTAFFPSDPKGSLSVQQLYDNEMGASIKKKRRKKIEITKTNWPFPFPLFFFKYPQYLEEIFIWIYMKLFAHVCFFLVPPAALWQITTALLFFLNSPPPSFCMNHLLNNPSLKEKQIVLIYEHAVWMTCWTVTVA